MWDDERDAQILTLRADGYTTAQIAEAVLGGKGRRNSVIGRLYRLAKAGKVAPPQAQHHHRRYEAWTPDEVRRLGEMIKAGDTRGMIAAAFGVSVKAIERLLTIERRKQNPDIPPATRAANGRRLVTKPKETSAERRARNDAERMMCFEKLFDPGFGTPLLELGPRQCRFSTGWDAEARRHLFCGDPTDVGRAYCPHHQSRCYPMEFSR
jgi:hypothetical protein